MALAFPFRQIIPWPNRPAGATAEAIPAWQPDFEALVNTHQSMVFSLALRMTGDPGLAEESCKVPGAARIAARDDEGPAAPSPGDRPGLGQGSGAEDDPGVGRKFEAHGPTGGGGHQPASSGYRLFIQTPERVSAIMGSATLRQAA